MSVERAKSVPPFVLWCTAMIPTAFDDSMSYYEALCALYKFIQDNLVEPINNNATILDQTVKDMAALKEYVDTYFDNLDVQEEINNKLDEMAEGGQLAAIISEFLELSPVFGYDTISDMSSATNLSDGSIARVLGNTSASEGDGAFYKVRTKESGETGDGYLKVEIGDALIADRITDGHDYLAIFDSVSAMAADSNLNTGDIVKTAGFYSPTSGGASTYIVREPLQDEVANGRSTIALQNDLIAELLPSETINVDQYGAYGDGVHDDYDAIQFAISNNLHHTIYFSDKTYAIGNTLKTWINTPKKTSFELTTTTKLKALNSLDALIEFGGLGGTIQTTADRRKVLRGGIFDATNCDAAIAIAQTDGNIEIRECEIININKYGIYAPSPASVNSCGLIMDGVIMYGIGGDFNTYGVYMERPDNEFMNSSIRGCRYAFYFGGEHNTGGQNITNVNGLGFGSGQAAWIEDSVYCRLVGTMNFIQDCYCDTFKTFVDVVGEATVSNCMYYSYMNNYDVVMFKLESPVSRLELKNNNLQFPSNPATKHKGIFFRSGQWNGQGTMKNVILSGNIIRANNDVMNQGDLLLTSDEPYEPYWSFTGQFTDSKWHKIGNVVATNIPYTLSIFTTGKRFDVDFAITRSGTTTNLTTYNTSKNDANITAQLGFVYNNSDSGYPTYSVYMRQTAGTAMWLNPIVNNFTPAKFMKISQNTLDPSGETMTISDTITI